MTFSERLPVNRDTLLQFVADFLSGKLISKAEADELAKKVYYDILKNKKKIYGHIYFPLCLSDKYMFPFICLLISLSHIFIFYMIEGFNESQVE